MSVSLCVAGEIYVLTGDLGGGLDACSGPIAVAHAPVQVSSTGALVAAFLDCCVVCFGFLDNSCLWFLFVGWRWRRNGRLGTWPVSEELVVAPSCVGGRSWLIRSCERDNTGLRSLLVSVSRGYAGHL